MRPVVNLKTAEGVRLFETLANDVADLVLEFGGALSGEHGDGMRGPFTEKDVRPGAPSGVPHRQAHVRSGRLLQPRQIVDTPPLTAHLRFGAGYQTPDPPAVFDYAEFGGLGRAVEMCSGLGVCRKTLEGTMPVVHGDARGEALDPRTGKHAAAGNGGPAG